MKTAAYRWDQAEAAASYDAAAPQIHPCYAAVQDALLAALPVERDASARVIDLGAGSGRLAERLLAAWPRATVTLVDRSEAFLGIARERLAPHAGRFDTLALSVQAAWPMEVGTADAIVSTSALHHLEGDEKNAAFAACRGVLKPGGVFINGDEHRPPSDADYRRELEAWGEHMASQLAAGAIPEGFAPVLDRWRERNLDGFGGPRTSGDDCHETLEEQAARLYGAGFRRVSTVWRDRLWAVTVAEA